MEIPKKLIVKWTVLRSPGDTKELASMNPGTSIETFNRAFRLGKCRDEVFEVMAKFYEDKAKMVKEFL